MSTRTDDRRNPNGVAPPGWGRRIETLRKARGLSLEDLHFEVRSRLGKTEAPGKETLRRYEVGVIEETDASLLALIVIAGVLGVPLKEVSPIAAERYKRIAPLWQNLGSTSTTEGGDFPGGEPGGNLTLQVSPSRSLAVAHDGLLLTQGSHRKSLTARVTKATLTGGAPIERQGFPTSWRGGVKDKAV